MCQLRILSICLQFCHGNAGVLRANQDNRRHCRRSTRIPDSQIYQGCGEKESWDDAKKKVLGRMDILDVLGSFKAATLTEKQVKRLR